MTSNRVATGTATFADEAPQGLFWYRQRGNFSDFIVEPVEDSVANGQIVTDTATVADGESHGLFCKGANK